ncbi:hydrolase [Sphingomonas sp. Leaf343]|uniref:hydrolase n=1 Tax=Sphingomonas sp. Leaf343 TaxID=1736345 RepID=UPI000A5A2E0C|nr:hydrolase [Sphingomonas sp. Leaf343]
MAGMTSNEQAVVARLDAAAMLAQVEHWAAINSGTRNIDGLARMATVLADAFAVLPGDVSLIEPAPVESVAADGNVSPLAHGRHLLVRVRPDAGRRVLLMGHMDTVYGADHAFQTLHWREPGVLIGPGVADMKGGLAAMLAALAAIEAEGGCALGYDVLINSDEETGSLSSAALIAEVAAGKVAALGYEPALADGTLVGARGGTGNFSIVVRGRSAHAGRNPEEGRNAIVAASEIAVRLADARGDGLWVNPARIEGGGPNNVVPELAVLRVNFRPRDAGAIMRAQAVVDRVTADVAGRRNVSVAVHGGFNRPPKPVDAGAEALQAVIEDAAGSLGIAVGWRDTGGVCDGNNIAAAGVAVVDTMGVRGGAIHSSDEFLLVDSLVERAALTAVTMLRIAARLPV